MTTNKRQRRPNFSEDFKREAIALVVEQGYSQAEAARSLGIGANLIGRWKRQYDDETSGERLNPEERDELKRLRREVRQLKMEKEILKKAAVHSTGQRNRYRKISVCKGLKNEKEIYAR